MGIIAVPILINLIVAIPTILGKKLFKNKDNLNKFKVLMSYGYLYNEYNKKNGYFWELVKI